MQEYQQKPDNETNQFPYGKGFKNFEQHRARKRFGFGIVIIIIGILILLKQFGFHSLLPVRDFWPFILILIGVLIGIKNKFRSPSSFILIIIGLVHAIPTFSFHVGDTVVYSSRLVAPLILIGAGLYFLLVSKKKRDFMPQPNAINNENYINRDVLFGGAKEVITSKEFTGGDVLAAFGGAEINLTQADMTASVVYMNVRTVFGGCEIIVPSHWDVKNEMFVALGSVEDQRVIRTKDADAARKTLVLKGFCVFGGVEVKSF